VIFGSEITNLVEGVTKVSKVKLRGSHEDQFVENLRRMFLAMAYDLRVVFIKLADRLHNMKTLWALPEEKRKRIAQETLEIYAPLAERLGMGEIHGALEDLAFCYLYLPIMNDWSNYPGLFIKTAEETIKIVKRKLLRLLAEENIRVTIQSRKKHFYFTLDKVKKAGSKRRLLQNLRYCCFKNNN